MRDVNPEKTLQELAQEAIAFIKKLAINPRAELAHLPEWSVKQVLIVQLGMSLVSGLITGFLPPTFWKILQGIILFPLLASIMGALLAAFFYYFFQIFEGKLVSFPKLLTLVYFANFPFFLFHIASSIFPVSDIAGLAFTAALLMIGLSENFALERKKSIRLVGSIFSLLFLLWLIEKVLTYRQTHSLD